MKRALRYTAAMTMAAALILVGLFATVFFVITIFGILAAPFFWISFGAIISKVIIWGVK